MLIKIDNNLYIGTSASEILHLVCLPPEQEFDPPQYILATRLQPSGYDLAGTTGLPGVQQILVLPGANKAVILCNGTASFYTLPELSPAFPNRQPAGVQYIGGYDEDAGRDHPDGTAIMMAMQRSIQRVHIGEKLQALKPPISYPDCHQAARRGSIACVADGKSYALLEIEHQQKIPLFQISSEPEPPPQSTGSLAPGNSHSRSKSMGDFAPRSRDASPGSQRIPSPAFPERTDSRSPNRPRASSAENKSPGISPKPSRVRPLQPLVLTPSANEFMLTTGTTWCEPGVGMFVNLDGDVSRGTIEFTHYPLALLAYRFDSQQNQAEDAADFVIALLEESASDTIKRGLQVVSLSDEQRSPPSMSWISLPTEDQSMEGQAGLYKALDEQQYKFTDVGELLLAVRFRLNREINEKQLESDPRTSSPIERLERESALFENNSNGSTTPIQDTKRNAEELAFVQRFGVTSTRALIWSGDCLWHFLRNPLLLQLESQLLRTIAVDDGRFDFARVNVPQLLSFLGSVRDHDPQDEAEFLGIKYARQKASIVLFLHLLSGIHSNQNLRAACQIAESALHEGEIDPRVILSLLRPLSREVIQGKDGIWINQGIADCFEGFQSPVSGFKAISLDFWLMIRHYLSTWQEKRGFGSISDEKAVFDSVDASLLHLLLHIDTSISRGDGIAIPIRAKLNNVVDFWKGDFERAITLLEHYKRLYLLSRLYQSRRSAKDVLSTWKRICEGEDSADLDVTADTIFESMRKYLTAIRDVSLVKEYSIWLAQRRPDLAVQVLSDENSRVKFTPAEVVPILKAQAPGSVQLFLEHLVFAKNLDQYADDLVGYYLDSMLSVLESSKQARQSLAESYTTYRALTSPKPTYLNFIQQNAPAESWWQSRLRLLQLLGTGGYATSTGPSKTLTYSIELVLDRLKPYSQYLVSESIILDARQGRHDEALQLLVHGLGDYDTAVRYCYFGGPTSPTTTIDISQLPSPEQQRKQFQFLFGEFLLIEDEEERLERTSHLLGTFAGFFDPLTVLNNIPDAWSISLLSEFLLRTIRAAVTERNQAIIIKALSAAQNLQKQAEFIETCEKIGATLETGPDASIVSDEIGVE